MPHAVVSENAFDVIVVGGGNAALCAALAADESGARVVLLEAATREERGGNSRFSGAAFRAAHLGWDHVKPVLTPQGLRDAEDCIMGPYTAEDYRNELAEASNGRNDRDLSEVIIRDSWHTIEWMKSKGVEWETTVRKYYAGNTGAVITLNSGAPVKAVGDGVGLIARLFEAVEASNIVLRYEAPVQDLLAKGDHILGVRVRTLQGYEEVTGAVILASGGFSANPAMKRQYLGEGWDLVPVRGSRYSTGSLLCKAIELGARPAGHWGAAHASPQDMGAPFVGDITKTPVIPRYSYTFGITVNMNGVRFFDEGEAEFALTYAKTGKKIGDQPMSIAWQIFDQQTIHLLQPRYSSGKPILAATLAELATKLQIKPARLTQTVEEFNNACESEKPFDPYRCDGKATSSLLQIPKSNWALPIKDGPFVAYGVTCGITFTYGGLASDTKARVLNNEGRPMPGLYCAGEIAGGVFYHNYPGGAGLTKGAVFGRIAAREATHFAKGMQSITKMIREGDGTT
jgi:tricarballylate dehydrogenase